MLHMIYDAAVIKFAVTQLPKLSVSSFRNTYHGHDIMYERQRREEIFWQDRNEGEVKMSKLVHSRLSQKFTSQAISLLTMANIFRHLFKNSV